MIYLYKCNRCETEFEVIKSMSESSRDEFHCGEKAQRKFSSLGVRWGQGMWEYDDIIGEGDDRKRTENGMGDHWVHNW